MVEFVSGLDARQREYFLLRELQAEQRLQTILAQLSRGISGVAELHGESISLRLSRPDAKRRSGKQT